MAKHRFKSKDFVVDPGSKIALHKVSTKPGKELDSKELAVGALNDDLNFLKSTQEKLFAEDKQSLVVILQGMDAAGKDGCIEQVFSGVNPQGCTVHSFKAPNAEELEHHFLWRPMRYLPARGKIAIFNRSYYEEVLVVRVHPTFLQPQRLPEHKSLDHLWEQRFKEIKTFESMLSSHGTRVVKFFLHVSPEEQLNRLLARLEDPDKHWKVNLGDFEERKLWDKYQDAFEAMLPATSTKESPWYIVPADSKWYARAVVADLVAQQLDDMNVDYPKVSEEDSNRFLQLAQQLRTSDSKPEEVVEDADSAKPARSKKKNKNK